jgi:DnaK suppressor protein
MDKEHIDRFRRQLLALRQEILEQKESAQESGATVELDQARVGRLSRMDAMQAQQMAMETDRRRSVHLQNTDGALRRIESGEFGYCFVCGEEIDLRRLEIDPTITRCIRCAESS